MSSEALSPALATVVHKLAVLIDEGNVLKAAVDGGWRYYGETFQKEIDNLKDMLVSGGNTVSTSLVMHYLFC